MKVLVTTLLFTRGRGGGCVVGSAFKTRPPSVLAGRRDFHELLLPFDDNNNQDPTRQILASKRRQDFVDGMQRAGIGRIAFLRHGKTDPKPDWGTDFDRVLTEEGREQARVSGASFGRDMLPPYHGTAIVSPAPRTMETAKIFLEAAGASSSVRLEAAAEVYDGTMQPGGPKLFAKIGYAPLADYVRNNSNDLDRATARRLLGAYGDFESWHGDWVWPTFILVGMGWSFAFLIAGPLDHLLKAKKAPGVMRALAYLAVLWLVDAALWLVMLQGQVF